MHALKKFGRLACAMSILSLALTTIAAAQEEEDDGFWGSAQSNDEIAIELLNPAGSLFSLANDFTHRPMQGSLPEADDQESLTYLMKVVWPMRLDNGKVLSFRADIPFNLDQPIYLVDGTMNNTEFADWRIRQDAEVVRRDGTFFDVHDHLYDINYEILYGGVSNSGFISMYGIAGVLPTSQDGTVERDAWMLGPAIAFGKLADWGIIGARANHTWEVASASDRLKQYDHQMTTIQVFFAYGLGNGWSIISNPLIEYDWEAASDNKLLLPLGAGISKTVRWGKIPLKFDLEFQHYLETPDTFGPDWMLRFGITPVLSDRFD